MKFKIIDPLLNQEVIVKGGGIRVLPHLQKSYGGRNWRKLKGWATVELENGRVLHQVEVHWFEAHGVGKVRMKIKT